MIRKNAQESLNILNDAINRAEGIPKEAGAGKAGLIGAGIGGTIGGLAGWTMADEGEEEEAAFGGAVLGAGAGAITGIAGSVLLSQLRQKQKKKRGEYTIPTQMGLVDVEQAYEDVYGSQLSEEAAQADAAAKVAGAPWRNKEKLKRFLRYKEAPSLEAKVKLVDYERAGIEPFTGRSDLQELSLPYEDKDTRETRSRGQIENEKSVVNFFGKDIPAYMGWTEEDLDRLTSDETSKELMMHELNHFLTAGDHTKSTEDYLRKQLKDEGVLPGPGQLSDWSLTYPELDPAEVTPPLSAMQHWWFKRTGDRIENDAQYDEAIKIMESTPNEQLPLEVLRFKRYREHLDSRGKLEGYDKVNRKLIPTIVKDEVFNFLMGDSMKKVAEEVEHINTGLDILNNTIRKLEGK
jgi:hypothetical protein